MAYMWYREVYKYECFISSFGILYLIARPWSLELLCAYYYILMRLVVMLSLCVYFSVSLLTRLQTLLSLHMYGMSEPSKARREIAVE